MDPVRLRGTTGGTFVFLQRDRSIGQLVDGESPQEARDGKEQDALSHRNAWADTATKSRVSISTINTEGMRLPSSEGPVVALHCVGLMSGFGTAQGIIDIAIRIEGVPEGEVSNHTEYCRIREDTHGSG